MRYVEGIDLVEVILHIVDPSRPDGLVLSERSLPMADLERVAVYFTQHIENALRDPAARAACFVHIEAGQTSGICAAVLAGELGLVPASQALAKKLHGIMARDRRIAPGDLAACLYRAASRPDVPAYLALLKIDPSEVFRNKTERDAEGRLYVSFEIASGALPTTGERLQKAAFVQPFEPRPEYDMMLLDRQARPLDGSAVARFFTEDFLGAELAFDPHQRTHRLYRALVSAQNLLLPVLSPTEADSLRAAIAAAINSDLINIDRWLAELPLREEHKRQIDRVISQELPDREFEIDRTYAGQLRRKRRFRGDHGLRLEVLAEHIDQVVRSVEIVDEPGAPRRWRVVIESELWEELSR